MAQTRLDERTRRRCVELCRDAAMHGSVVVVVVVVVVHVVVVVIIVVEKEEGLSVAQTRLDERTRRRCVELCRDAAMHGSVVVVVVVHVVVVD